MNIIVEFYLMLEDNVIEGEVKKKFAELKLALNEYSTGKQFIFQEVYHVDDQNPLFDAVINFAKQYLKKVDLGILDYWARYSEEDVKDAVAFMPVFHKPYCEEYEDTYMEYEECDWCDCRRNKRQKYRFIQNKGYIKKYSNTYG
ncbi:MAG: hypothetical protein Q4F21_08200, partial [Lachnospiraceae bacterium]|nr:hypothetical protein [Lachnospiraceae bacterium]